MQPLKPGDISLAANGAVQVGSPYWDRQVKKGKPGDFVAQASTNGTCENTSDCRGSTNTTCNNYTVCTNAKNKTCVINNESEGPIDP